MQKSNREHTHKRTLRWYQFDIRNLSEAEYQKWYSLMSEERRARIDRFRSSDDKKLTVAGEIMARNSIAEWCGVPAESIHFARTEYGKPFAIDLPVEFNISHSGNTVACAVSDTPVGIDVEEIRPVDLNVAKHICTDDDLKYLFGHTPDDEDFDETNDRDLLIRFFKIWTAKEAYFKYLGTGIVDFKGISYVSISKKAQLLQFIKNQAVFAVLGTKMEVR